MLGRRRASSSIYKAFVNCNLYIVFCCYDWFMYVIIKFYDMTCKFYDPACKYKREMFVCMLDIEKDNSRNVK